MLENQIDPIEQIGRDILNEVESAENKEIEINVDGDGVPSSFLVAETPSLTEEEEKAQKKNAYQKRKLANLQREKNRLADEARRLAEENVYLRNQSELALAKANSLNDVSMAHYQDKVIAHQEYLKEQYKKAEEMGDVDQKFEVDKQVARLAAEQAALDAYNLQRYQEQQQYQQNVPSYQQPYYPPSQYPSSVEESVDIPEETHNWVKRHKWLIEGHEDYDPDKVKDVLLYSQLLDSDYKRNGDKSLLYSDQYYKDLDNYIYSKFGDELSDYFPSQRKQKMSNPQYPQANTQQSRQLEQSFSNNARVPIAPVRKGSSGNYHSSSPNVVNFTNIDKEMMAQWKRYGITPEAYAKAKLKVNEQYKQAIDSGDMSSMQAWGLL